MVRRVKLPFQPPIEPMLARLAAQIPDGDDWQFEPKWDGFRAIVFRDGAETLIQSRDLKPLDRYFPELAAPIRNHSGTVIASLSLSGPATRIPKGRIPDLAVCVRGVAAKLSSRLGYRGQ